MKLEVYTLKLTNTTLLEQMNISDIEILSRLSLLDLPREDLRKLQVYHNFMKDNIDDIVEEFYVNQTEIDEVTLLIGDAETLHRLKASLRRYVLELFSGYCDSEYVNNRLRIGMVHKRIGVEPKLYLAAIMQLKKIVFIKLNTFINDEKQYDMVIDLLDKLLSFDTTLVFDTYIDSLLGEVKSAKNKAEDYAHSLEEKVAERTKQLEELAQCDSLTDIYNQRAMYDFLRRELLVAKRNEENLSVIYFDIDDFKKINDEEGHLKGDEVLKATSQCILQSKRETDLACRYGGDEFCLVLPNCNTENAHRICEEIVTHFTHRYPNYSISMGVSETGADNWCLPEEMIRQADEKMYSSKKSAGCIINH